MTDWILTLPKVVRWADYERELAAAAGGLVMNYRVPVRVGVEAGDRVFTLWDGRVRGWMAALGVAERAHGFECLTTGARWPPGFYVMRTGAFHPVGGPSMRGFQGIRRYKAEEEGSI